MNYLSLVENMQAVLKLNAFEKYAVALDEAKLRGGTGGEILLIICSLLKTYERKLPNVFKCIKNQALQLYDYCEEIGMHPIANESLLKELISE